MIARIAVEPVEGRLLLRIATENVAFDILTDSTSLAAAKELAERSDHGFGEAAIGTFGPFPVVVSRDATGRVAIALDGPELGPHIRGNQAVVLYATQAEAAELFRM